MKIKLACDLPLDAKHGATMGAVFDVLHVDMRDARRPSEDRYIFRGKSGELCAARFTDVLVVEELPEPPVLR